MLDLIPEKNWVSHHGVNRFLCKFEIQPLDMYDQLHGGSLL